MMATIWESTDNWLRELSDDGQLFRESTFTQSISRRSDPDS